MLRFGRFCMLVLTNVDKSCFVIVEFRELIFLFMTKDFDQTSGTLSKCYRNTILLIMIYSYALALIDSKVSHQ